MTPSRKQIIYQDILWWALPHIRNTSTLEWWHRLSNKSTFYEAELIHNLPVCLFGPEFTEADVYFLNHQARYYTQRCSSKLSILYPQQVERISQLFLLVPETLRNQLQWEGPLNLYEQLPTLKTDF